MIIETMKRYNLIKFLVTLLLFSACGAMAAEPPMPAAVAGTVQSLWKSKKFPELERYITALNAEFPNYIPAMLAESFYLCAYRGKLPAARALLTKVRQDCDKRPMLYTDDFKTRFAQMETVLNSAIEIALENGISSAQEEAAASPEKMWKISHEREAKELGMLTELEILSYAPNITLPAK